MKCLWWHRTLENYNCAPLMTLQLRAELGCLLAFKRGQDVNSESFLTSIWENVLAENPLMQLCAKSPFDRTRRCSRALWKPSPPENKPLKKNLRDWGRGGAWVRPVYNSGFVSVLQREERRTTASSHRTPPGLHSPPSIMDQVSLLPPPTCFFQAEGDSVHHSPNLSLTLWLQHKNTELLQSKLSGSRGRTGSREEQQIHGFQIWMLENIHFIIQIMFTLCR